MVANKVDLAKGTAGEVGCIFCNPDSSRILAGNELAYVLQDGFPVTEGHSLVIPRRHAADYLGLTQEELLACDELIREASRLLVTRDPAIAGFNIGANCGAAAGQTIFHCHIHLIPRRVGDVDNPRGGVRHIIPGKGFY
jgi:diadenosine tetraphosphate (Ap4A) HIT family hydrolase